ncbi:glycosyltransferase family 25 protein [Prosthecomicrobium pneumaticum]|uniref:Glycosyl transferase family 25 n=1 Tax=Prosthecomicrobium pneumaticum TaxID=81895 RepID=A0A7W9CTC6_9HYPH|nr:glycosyltransferase family 25 protein [Prosthecomicrobium pneumaticum]MBB5751477.1 glycosyl transferase family 25 [Prosthecomicrobium pneumaticum]
MRSDIDILVVNLERSTERRTLMAEQLDRLGVVYQFFPAFDGRKGEHAREFRYDPAIAARHGLRPLTPGELGCAASHVAIWRRCSETGRPVIVLEDDVITEDRFAEDVPLIRDLVERYPLLRIAAIRERPGRVVESLPRGRQVVRLSNGPRGTMGYALSPQGARALLHEIDTLAEPIDHYIDMFWLHGLRIMALKPYPVWERPSDGLPSTIESIRWDHRASFPNKIAREAHRLLGEVMRVSYNASDYFTSIGRS